MKWSVDEDDPPIVGLGYKIFVDGEEAAKVTAFDTDEGWIVKQCQGELGSNHPTEPHIDADDPDQVCEVKLEGQVEVVSPDGIPVS